MIITIIKRKILSVETILSAHTHTHTGSHTHQYTDDTKFNLHTTERDSTRPKISPTLHGSDKVSNPYSPYPHPPSLSLNPPALLFSSLTFSVPTIPEVWILIAWLISLFLGYFPSSAVPQTNSGLAGELAQKMKTDVGSALCLEAIWP